MLRYTNILVQAHNVHYILASYTVYVWLFKILERLAVEADKLNGKERTHYAYSDLFALSYIMSFFGCKWSDELETKNAYQPIIVIGAQLVNVYLYHIVATFYT